MKNSFKKTFVVGALLYLSVGVIVGLVTMLENAGEDLGIRQLCKTWAECQSQNAYHIAAGVVIWPLYIISNPLLLGALVFIAALLYWSMKKPKTANARKPE